MIPLLKITAAMFWMFCRVSKFVNPVISWGLIVLHYLAWIIKESCIVWRYSQKCCNSDGSWRAVEYVSYDGRSNGFNRNRDAPSKMDSFSDEVMEDMR